MALIIASSWILYCYQTLGVINISFSVRMSEFIGIVLFDFNI